MLAFGIVTVPPGLTRNELLAGPYEVGVAGERFPMTALPRAPYDPDGRRMRG